MRLGLINLQKVYLSKCRLSHISPRTFRGLSNLVDLDLSYNVMREVPSGAFPDCQGLMRLILSGNPIQRIQRNAFISLESLTTLEISNAGIELIEKVSLQISNTTTVYVIRLKDDPHGCVSLPLSGCLSLCAWRNDREGICRIAVA